MPVRSSSRSVPRPGGWRRACGAIPTIAAGRVDRPEPGRSPSHAGRSRGGPDDGPGSTRRDRTRDSLAIRTRVSRFGRGRGVGDPAAGIRLDFEGVRRRGIGRNRQGRAKGTEDGGWARSRSGVVLLAVAATRRRPMTGPAPRVGPAGDSTRATVELKAEGSFKPATPPGSPEPKPLALKVETRVEFDERVGVVDARGQPEPGGPPGRAGRRDDQRRGPALGLGAPARGRHAGRRPPRGPVAVVSVGGPLTRAELELVQGPGDPLALASLLPTRPVAVGDRWTVGELAARNLSGYDALAATPWRRPWRPSTTTRPGSGSWGRSGARRSGARGRWPATGRSPSTARPNRVDRLTLRRAETRRPGPIEAGLDVKSVLTVDRGPSSPRPSRSTTTASLARAAEAARAARPPPVQRRPTASIRCSTTATGTSTGTTTARWSSSGSTGASWSPSATSRPARTPARGGTRTSTSSATTSARRWASGSSGFVGEGEVEGAAGRRLPLQGHGPGAAG